ncbi:MAG TPA: Gfo/Idh/MocA family oxidoreductase, partial [Cyclobacteriaceae bacterium]|nr:Gfo/Idh/MocA family oxidoreductase [Cyclobacteriaceae bacterium]
MKQETKSTSRRKFVKDLAGAGLAASAFPYLALHKTGRHQITLQPEPYPNAGKKYSANDKIRVGVIGAGIIGFYNMDSALSVNGVEIAAVCDLYDGRLTRAKEVRGSGIFTTKDYREILSRPDIDVVLVATPDHWHDIISIDAM